MSPDKIPRLFLITPDKGFPGGSDGKESACNAEDPDLLLGLVRSFSLEKGMATRFSILAWRSPWTEERGRLQAMGHKVSDNKKKVGLLSVQFSRSVMSDSLWPHESQHTRPLVHHKLPEFTQTHVHQVSDAIQPSHPLSSPSPPSPNPFQHQGLFQWFSSLHQVAKVLEFQLQHQSFQSTPRTDLL